MVRVEWVMGLGMGGVTRDADRSAERTQHNPRVEDPKSSD